MRIRVTKHPTGSIEGISLDRFHVGGVYDLGTEIASVFLAEGWAQVDVPSAADAMVARGEDAPATAVITVRGDRIPS
jgi:hypothetical protein